MLVLAFRRTKWGLEAGMTGAPMASFKYTQVEFNIISVKVCAPKMVLPTDVFDVLVWAFLDGTA